MGGFVRISDRRRLNEAAGPALPQAGAPQPRFHVDEYTAGDPLDTLSTRMAGIIEPGLATFQAATMVGALFPRASASCLPAGSQQRDSSLQKPERGHRADAIGRYGLGPLRPGDG